jgi:hypothetical protein
MQKQTNTGMVQRPPAGVMRAPPYLLSYFGWE